MVDTITSFVVSRNTFREFVRMKVKSQPFVISGQEHLFGSRVSDWRDWHCSYYAKRADAGNMEGDYATVSASAPLKYNKNQTGNGTVVITLASTAPTDSYFLSYTSAQNSWYLSNASATGFGDSGLPAPNGTWTVTFNGVTAVITPGSIPFDTEFNWVFNTFRTTMSSGIKPNEIDLNYVNPTTGY